MKFRRLMLGCYGHLSDVMLEFPEAPGLHVVLGANEAGKSTALTAIGDCLFGFPHRTTYAFLHATRDLRIGATLQARDGRQATFVRRKGRKQDLCDDHDQPQPESAIAAFLSGATRERFDRVFGLNGTELRQGGDAILQGHGEVGEAILGAHTGLHGFRAKVEALGIEAGKLFGDRKGRRAFHEAADRFNRARHDVAERRIEPTAWKQARDDLTALQG
jgi:chromosome segregation protein